MLQGHKQWQLYFRINDEKSFSVCCLYSLIVDKTKKHFFVKWFKKQTIHNHYMYNKLTLFDNDKRTIGDNKSFVELANNKIEEIKSVSRILVG